MAVADVTLTLKVAPRDQLLLNNVESAARAADRPARPLHLQALLQLPRLADINGLVSGRATKELLAELAQELPTRAEWLIQGAVSSPRLLGFHRISDERARDIMQRFHYLRSPRIDGRAYGLSTVDGNLVALCVSSPLDVEYLRKLLVPTGHRPEFARVVSGEQN